ncbi:hypothetical protein Nepgr_028377 [Nepenthes gracilis]|uniref:Tower domain-containing protein n=1 Tax=Nepenthes gracilis TaxID=150966 RepID=A0AAD3Y422_NEPGR|nr:hypothetical protein Nepgr_028377 [Nepenthes gracilis]
MSDWWIVPVGGNNFRWEVSGLEHQTKPHQDKPLHCSPPRLPSMADLLIQGCSKIVGNPDRNDDDVPIFRTGLGKPLILKQSSVAKALYVLRHGDGDDDIGPSSRQDHGTTFLIPFSKLPQGKCFNPVDKEFTTKELYDPVYFSHLEEKRARVNRTGTWNDDTVANVPLHIWTGSLGNGFNEDDVGKLVHPDMCNSEPKPPPIMFYTACGRSISVSSEALQQARSLLGDPEVGNLSKDVDSDDCAFSFLKERNLNADSLNRGNILNSSLMHRSDSIQKLDAEENGESLCTPKPLCRKSSLPCVTQNSMATEPVPIFNTLKRASKGPLVDITNNIGPEYENKRTPTSEIRRLSRRSSISPFKRPRSSKFVPPFNCIVPSAPNGLSNCSTENSYGRKRVCIRYPFQVSRKYVKEFFEVPPSHCNMSEHIPDQVRWIHPGNAKNFVFCGENGLDSIGIEAFFHMLAQSGASRQYASKEWVANHHKWIVWKLACYEISYSAKFPIKFLTVSNVLEELKYRYEREVNHGHHSAVKRIWDGDAPPSSMMILCISAIHSECYSEVDTQAKHKSEKNNAVRIELTDGWYSIDAQLDVLLSQYLAVGKLFVGQKLRICGADLCGWTGPLSPFEATNVHLLLHVNGTYRAGWADRLGFCRVACTPLAFRCIKGNGGPVPLTLVGVTRIYPILYRERLSNGRCIVRSDKMEAKFMQLHNQKCSNIIEDIMSEFQRGVNRSSCTNDRNNEEGAKILKMLETAAEPEVLMVEMSSEQLASLSTYKAKLEAIRQSDMQKSIEKALKAAGLSDREVTPFMRVRVAGLTRKGQPKRRGPDEGLITIWNPTEKQLLELVEGQAYAVSGLTPLHPVSNILFLQARGSINKWQALTSLQKEFLPFFCPRESVLLSKLGEVALAREFDTTVLVIHVGQVYITAQQKKQWVFVTDGSISMLQTEEPTAPLLAISFCSPCVEGDSVLPVNYNLVGSIVGFCNLIKRTKDTVNDLWVAEATENSTYHLNYDHQHCSHLKNASIAVQRWADSSSLIIEKLRKKVLFIVGDLNG